MNNERQLEQSLSRFFKGLSEEVLKNLEEYWSDYQLLQGQIQLIIEPITNAEQEYYTILVVTCGKIGQMKKTRIPQNRMMV